jgi:ABC-type branched-subunit amino acid transport system substrate-binding protein
MTEKETVSRRKYVTAGLGAAALAGWGVAGYLASKPPAPSPGAITTTVTGAEGTILIGGLFCTSGASAIFGAGMKTAIEVALDDINRELEDLGSNVRFDMVSADTGTTAEGALRAATSLAETNGVRAFAGPGNSIEFGGIKAYCDANKIVAIGESSSEAYSLADYLFRVFPTNHLMGPPVARLMWSLGIRNVGCLYRDDAFGSSLHDVTKAEFERLGGTWKSIKYMIDLPDYSSEVAALSSAVSEFGADEKTGVFHVTFETDGLNIYGHAAIDPVLSKVKWFGTTDAKRDAFLPPVAPEAIGDFLVKVESQGLFPVNPLNALNKKFTEKFKAWPDRPYDAASGYDTYFYDCAWILALSLIQTQGKFGEPLWKAIPDVAGRYIGASGATPLDKNGDLAQTDFGLWHAVKKDGKYQYEYYKYYSATTGGFADWIPGAYMA